MAELAGRPAEPTISVLAEPTRSVPAGDGPRLVKVSDVQPQPVRWLWLGYVPAGKLTVIDGDPGDGKSTLSLDLAARVSTGSPLPDGSACERGNVLVLSAEDGIADTIRPRLDAAGADTERVAVLDEVVEAGKGRPVELPADLDHVEAIIAAHQVRLVTIDPLMAFLAGSVDAHSDQSVRRALHPLAKLAEATGAAIVVIRHLNKSGGGRAMYRGGGSIGITGAARAVHLVGADPDDDDRRLLACVKLNVATKPPTLAYRLVADPLHGVARVQWDGTSHHGADDLLASGDELSDRDEARCWLRHALEPGPRQVTDLEAGAKSAGLHWETIKKAKGDLKVASQRTGFGPRAHYSWSLPTAMQGPCSPCRDTDGVSLHDLHGEDDGLDATESDAMKQRMGEQLGEDPW